MKKFDLLAYFLLFLVIAFGGFIFWRASFEPQVRLLVFLVLIGFYLVWGSLYHHIKHNFTGGLFLEYLLVGAIAAVAAILLFN
jgi:hypothetical protein